MAGTPLSEAPRRSSLSQNARFFNCTIKDTGEPRVLAIDFPNLYLLSVEDHIMATFPLKYLRGYGQLKNLFSFETGRKCPGGVQTYYFVMQNDEDMFVALNEEIASHNNGVGSDRYDHLPAFKKGNSSSSVVSRRSNASAVSGAPQETYSGLSRPNTRPASTFENPQEYASLQRGSPATIGEYEDPNARSAAPARPPPRGTSGPIAESTYNSLAAGRTTSVTSPDGYSHIPGRQAPVPTSPDGYSHFQGRQPSVSADSYAHISSGRSPAAQDGAYSQLSSHGAAASGDTYSHISSRNAAPQDELSYSTLAATNPTSEGSYSSLSSRGAAAPSQHAYEQASRGWPAPASGYEQAGAAAGYGRSPAASSYMQSSAAQLYDKF